MTWKRLAHQEITSTGDNFSEFTFDSADILKVVMYVVKQGTGDLTLYPNAVTSGSNFSASYTKNGGAYSGNNNHNGIHGNYGQLAGNTLATYHINNLKTSEKLVQWNYCIDTGSASTNLPDRFEAVGKYTDTSNQITSFSATLGAGGFGAGSYITVWGDASDVVTDEKQTLADATRTESATATFTEDFSGSDNWTDSDSSNIGVNTTDNDLDFSMIRDGSNDTCVYDLQHADALNGSNASDTKWALRFKINFSAISGGSSNGNDIWIGLSDKDESAGSTTSQDFIGIDMNMDNTNVMRSATTNDGTFPLGAGSSTVNWTPSTSTDYYVQIIRTSSTNATIDIFSDSSYSTKAFTTLSYSVSSSTQSLRYIKIANRVDSGGGRTITGTIDDVKFYNNISAVDTTVSTAPNAGTQYRETDTRKIYRRVAEGTFTSTDYTTSNFTAVGSTVAITSNSAVSTSTPSNTANRVYATIPSLKSTDAWSCDFQLYVTADATNDYHTIAFCTNSDAFNTSGQNHISVQTQGGSYNRFVLNARIDGVNTETATSSSTRSLSTNYYCTLSSDGAGTARMRIWTNSDRTGTPAQDKTLSIANIGTLTTVMHGTRNSGDSNVWSGTVSNVSLTNPAKWVERGSA